MPYKEIKVERLYYSIGETAEMLEVPVSTIRFWENEFDIRNLRIIHHILKEEGMTLAGAKKKLTERWDDTTYKFEINESLQKIKSILLDIKENI